MSSLQENRTELGTRNNQQKQQTTTQPSVDAGLGKITTTTTTAAKKEIVNALFQMCQNNHWESCLQLLEENPEIGVTPFPMGNHIVTTVCHQAITSKGGDTKSRCALLLRVLEKSPQAARIRNGNGSLCIHAICQRNVKMDSKTKATVIRALIDAYPGSLLETGGQGKRTPLHIIFTDYVSTDLVRLMIEKGKKATFLRDSKGYLPLHVAVSRHTSLDKLNMLLEANPKSILEKTDDGKTALQLAMETATQAHPNTSLINALRLKLASMDVDDSGSRNDNDFKLPSEASSMNFLPSKRGATNQVVPSPNHVISKKPRKLCSVDTSSSDDSRGSSHHPGSCKEMTPLREETESTPNLQMSSLLPIGARIASTMSSSKAPSGGAVDSITSSEHQLLINTTNSSAATTSRTTLTGTGNPELNSLEETKSASESNFGLVGVVRPHSKVLDVDTSDAELACKIQRQRQIAEYLCTDLIGCNPNPHCMERYACHLYDEGFQSTEMIMVYLKPSHVTEFNWMLPFHKDIILQKLRSQSAAFEHQDEQGWVSI